MSHNDTHLEGAEAAKALWEKIKEVRIAMFTTVTEDGDLWSRPMANQTQDFDGNLWFFTYDDSPKVKELERNPRVNLTFADPDKSLFVTVSGTADVVDDREKAEELWNPMAKAWFPGGLDDPKLTLLKVDVEQAEYWEDDKPQLLQLAGMLKAAITGTVPDGGEDKKLTL